LVENIIFSLVIIRPWRVVSGLFFHSPAYAGTAPHFKYPTPGMATFRQDNFTGLGPGHPDVTAYRDTFCSATLAILFEV
jgi:hypothetical protein